MLRSLSISSFRLPRLPGSLIALLAVGATFLAVNWVVLRIAPYLDANFVNMHSINNDSWIEGGDVLFLGDSRGQQGLVPAEFEQAMRERGIQASAFNMARPGMQIPFSYYFSKRAVETAETPPKMVVVNFSFYLLGGTQWMRDIYWAYYRPSFSEAYHACIMRLLNCTDAAEWWARTRVPLWMFRIRANNLVRQAVTSPAGMLSQLRGIYNLNAVARHEVAKGYTSMGYMHIVQEDVRPHDYRRGIERGYSVYIDYLRQMLNELSAQNIHIYIYRYPWPESRQHEEDFIEIENYYWELIKQGNYESSTVNFLDELYFWPNQYFHNPLHLNHPGAIKLTRTLTDLIAERSGHLDN